jgi:Pyridoxamine 5'-phosphate oxidase
VTGEPAPSRPLIPASYGIGKGGSTPGELLPWAQVVEWLESARNYWICTTRPDGRPHAKPVWGLWMDGMLMFSTDPDSVTGRNLLAGSPLQAHLESGDEVAILDGDVERPLDPALLARFADAYDAKYGIKVDVTRSETPILALRPTTVLSWTEANYPETATRWTLPGEGDPT